MWVVDGMASVAAFAPCSWYLSIGSPTCDVPAVGKCSAMMGAPFYCSLPEVPWQTIVSGLSGQCTGAPSQLSSYYHERNRWPQLRKALGMGLANPYYPTSRSVPCTWTSFATEFALFRRYTALPAVQDDHTCDGSTADHCDPRLDSSLRDVRRLATHTWPLRLLWVGRRHGLRPFTDMFLHCQ